VLAVRASRAAGATALGEAVDVVVEEEAVDDQLAAPLEQVEQGDRAVRALEGVLLLDGHPGHAAALGGERVTVAGVLLLLDEQGVARLLPFVR